MLDPYDAVLLLSFGGPEGPDEVMPFLRHVTGGRGIPDERLAEVAEHYVARGGISPINGENRALIAALEAELRARGVELPVIWGNRHAAPFTADALREAHGRGLRRLVAVVTSAFPSYSGCRQYREDLADTVADLGLGDELRIDKLRPYSDHPGFVEASRARLVARLREFLAEHDLARPHIAYVTHSIPTAMEESSGRDGGEYLRRHRDLASLLDAAVAAEFGRAVPSSLVYCSRSGPPHQPWLEPDINDHIAELAAAGVDGVVVAPIGFVADHMEVVHDLDTEAAETAAERGLAFTRVPTVQDDPAFVSGLVDLLLERAAEARGAGVEPASVGTCGPMPSRCAPGCCPNLRAPRPALCGDDAPCDRTEAR